MNSMGRHGTGGVLFFGLIGNFKVSMKWLIDTPRHTMTRRDIHPDDEDLRLLRIEQVLELIPVARSSIYRMIDAQTFPAPEKLGSVSVWSNAEIRAWKDRKFPSQLAAPKSDPRSRRDNAGLI